MGSGKSKPCGVRPSDLGTAPPSNVVNFTLPETQAGETATPSTVMGIAAASEQAARPTHTRVYLGEDLSRILQSRYGISMKANHTYTLQERVITAICPFTKRKYTTVDWLDQALRESAAEGCQAYELKSRRREIEAGRGRQRKSSR